MLTSTKTRHPYAHAEQSERSHLLQFAESLIDIETKTIILDRQMQAIKLQGQRDGQGTRQRMTQDIRDRLLQHPETGQFKGRRQAPVVEIGLPINGYIS